MGVRISLPVQKKFRLAPQIGPDLLGKRKMSKIGNYIAETKNELLNKVSWPTWPELQSSAIVVMISSVIIALVVFGMDFVFELLMKQAYDMIK